MSGDVVNGGVEEEAGEVVEDGVAGVEGGRCPVKFGGRWWGEGGR